MKKSFPRGGKIPIAILIIRVIIYTKFNPTFLPLGLSDRSTVVLRKAMQNEAAVFKLEELPVQITHDWVVTLQLKSVQK